jgi:hypothetical protein
MLTYDVLVSQLRRYFVPETPCELAADVRSPLSKYALFPRLLHLSISPPAIALFQHHPPPPKHSNTGTAYLAVNSSKDSSWWGSWASTSPANLPAETEKAARWTGCCTKSALWAGRAKGVARARVALRMRAETDIVRVWCVVLGGAEMGESGYYSLSCAALLGWAGLLRCRRRRIGSFRVGDLAGRGEHVPALVGRAGNVRASPTIYCIFAFTRKTNI